MTPPSRESCPKQASSSAGAVALRSALTAVALVATGLAAGPILARATTHPAAGTAEVAPVACEPATQRVALPPGHPPVDASPELPPGHPPIDGIEPELPPGHPPLRSSPSLPPGHPPVEADEGGLPPKQPPIPAQPQPRLFPAVKVTVI
jgi:hypothetical protein